MDAQDLSSKQILATKPSERRPRLGNGDSLLKYLVLAARPGGLQASGFLSRPVLRTTLPNPDPAPNSWMVWHLRKLTLQPGCVFEHNSDDWVCYQIQILKMPLLANQREMWDFPQKMVPTKQKSTTKKKQTELHKHTVCFPTNIHGKWCPAYEFFIDFNMLLLSGLSLWCGTDGLENLERTQWSSSPPSSQWADPKPDLLYGAQAGWGPGDTEVDKGHMTCESQRKNAPHKIQVLPVLICDFYADLKAFEQVAIPAAPSGSIWTAVPTGSAPWSTKWTSVGQPHAGSPVSKEPDPSCLPSCVATQLITAAFKCKQTKIPACQVYCILCGYLSHNPIQLLAISKFCFIPGIRN